MNSAKTRWATFDCYGTLVDWNGGIGDQLERLFGPDSREAALARYHELEPQIETETPGAPYSGRTRQGARRRGGVAGARSPRR